MDNATDTNFWLISLPAVLALLFKGGIYAYAHYSKTHNLQTRLYLLALFALSIQNVSEISHFYTLLERGDDTEFRSNGVLRIEYCRPRFFFHLALSLSFGRPFGTKLNSLVVSIYGYAALLGVLLLFSLADRVATRVLVRA